VTPGELNQLQQLISGKELSREQLGFVRDSVATGAQTTGNQAQVVIDPNQSQPTDNLKQFVSFGFFFDNASPAPDSSVTDYTNYYNQYQSAVTGQGNKNYSGQTLQNFFTNVVNKNFDEIKNKFIPQLKKVLENQNIKVVLTLGGSASSSPKLPLNEKISANRIESVIKFLKSCSNTGWKCFIIT
jgi:hypothetical protein